MPLVYVATAIPRFATYSFHPLFAWLGLFFAIAALGMFHLTHRALGRNWSISLDVRENHELVTEGIYRRVRHPMYSAFWLWAIAQALLLPNWIAGFAGLAGFADFVLWPRRKRRANDVRDLWRQLSRVYGEDWPGLPVGILK